MNGLERNSPALSVALTFGVIFAVNTFSFLLVTRVTQASAHPIIPMHCFTLYCSTRLGYVIDWPISALPTFHSSIHPTLESRHSIFTIEHIIPNLALILIMSSQLSGSLIRSSGYHLVLAVVCVVSLCSQAFLFVRCRDKVLISLVNCMS